MASSRFSNIMSFLDEADEVKGPGQQVNRFSAPHSSASSSSRGDSRTRGLHLKISSNGSPSNIRPTEVRAPDAGGELDQEGDDNFDDGISSVSQSPVTNRSSLSYSSRNPPPPPYTSGAPKSSQRRLTESKYVWDEPDDERGDDIAWIPDMDSVRTGPVDGSDRVVDREFGGRDGSSGGASVTSGRSLGSVVVDLKEKVDNLKRTLQDKSQQARELHGELMRVAAAKEKRISKIKTQWESKQQEYREHHATVQSQFRDGLEKLSSDVTQLRSKRDALKERVDTFATAREDALNRAKTEAARSFARAQRQWEADEKASFEKMLVMRTERMKKQAADSFGVSMDKMVVEGKELVRLKRAEHESSLINLRRVLTADMETKLQETKELLHNQLQSDLDKQHRVSERRLDDLRRLQSEQLSAAREKHTRKRSEVEEAADRTRSMEAETVLESIRELRKAEVRLVSELGTRHQAELGQEASRFSAERLTLQKQLEKESEEESRRTKERMLKRMSEDRAAAINGARAKTAAETERVIGRLRAEVMEERASKQTELDKQLENLRLTWASKLDALKLNEERLAESVYSLKTDITKLQQAESGLVSRERTERSVLEKTMTRLEELKREIKVVELECERALQRKKEADERRRGADEADISRCEEEIELEKNIARIASDAAAKKREMMEMNQDQLERVREKVEILLEKKDNTITELSLALQQARSDAKELDDALRSLRSSHLEDASDVQFAALGVSSSTAKASRSSAARATASGSGSGPGRNTDVSDNNVRDTTGVDPALTGTTLGPSANRSTTTAPSRPKSALRTARK